MTVTAEGVTITTADDVMAAFIAALTAAPDTTVAGTRVFNPRSWPTPLGDLPILLLQSPVERKESLGPNAPSFDVIVHIKLQGRLTFKALPDDAGAALALDALATFQRQIERAVINNFALYRIISEIVSVDIVNEVKSEGNQPIAELTMDFACKFYQGPEAFAPPVLGTLDEMAIYMDLLNLYDPNGDYVPPMVYDVETSPRPSGPDGRVEIGAVVKLDQPNRIADDGSERVIDRSGKPRVVDRP